MMSLGTDSRDRAALALWLVVAAVVLLVVLSERAKFAEARTARPIDMPMLLEIVPGTLDLDESIVWTRDGAKIMKTQDALEKGLLRAAP